jgi:hypothetical protein
MEYKLVQNEGKWYKGNLHCHSTNSDGQMTPAEVAQHYKKNGYSFLMFSEHEIYTNNSEFNSEDFLIIPGVEKAHYLQEKNIEYHFLGIEEEDEVISRNGGKVFVHSEELKHIDMEKDKTVQDTVDYLKENSSIVVLNHPLWSRLEFEDMKDIDNIIGVEIFNYSGEQENMTGTSVQYLDMLLSRGRKLWCFATDDNHNYCYNNEMPREWDSCGGWISVYSKALTKNDIVKSIKEGKFYSSSGPEIYNIEVSKGKIFVECSPCEVIYFLTYPGYGASRRDPNGGLITKASCDFDESQKYIRIECRDAKGKVAWSNPIFLNQ